MTERALLDLHLTFLQKLRFLLSRQQKRELVILTGLMLVGMAFEMGGLGLMVPTLSLMLKTDIGKEYPAVLPYLEALGSPTQFQLVVWSMLFLVAFYLIKAVFLMYLNLKQAGFSIALSRGLSYELFFGYLCQPYAFHLQRNSAQLLRNIQSEVGIFGAASQSAISLAIDLSLISGVAFLLILVEPVGAVTVTFFLALSVFCFHRLTRHRLLDWGRQRQHYSGLTNQCLFQGLGGVKDVKLMGREKYFTDRYSEHNSAGAKIQTRVSALGLAPRLYLELLAVIGLAGLVIVMVLQSRPVDLLLPTLGVFVAAAFRMIPSVNRIMSSVQNIRYAQPAVELLYTEFCLIRNVENSKSSVVRLDFFKEICIQGLNFCYSGGHSNTLNEIFLKIRKGESVGFVGRSGSGKTTLIDIILGLLQASVGQVLVDGKDIQQNLRSWQDQIGYVPQSIYLMDDTLKRNIAFGLSDEQIDEPAIVRAIKAAQLDEFIASLPEGLDTLVGERGIRLSGGQRQRIGIARALYNDPPVLVLDEATSSLDTLTEKGVMDAVMAQRGKRTILIVAHRLSTVENCDRLYRLEGGKIVDEERRSSSVNLMNSYSEACSVY